MFLGLRPSLHAKRVSAGRVPVCFVLCDFTFLHTSLSSLMYLDH